MRKRSLARLAGLVALGMLVPLTACSPSGHPDASIARPLPRMKSEYAVTLKPTTVVVDAELMARAYRGATDDGMLNFDAAAAPSVAALTPGKVVIFAGVALLTVSSVKSSGGTISVSGVPAGLEDAIERGHIGWSTPIDFSAIAFNPPPGFHRSGAETKPMLAWANFLLPPAQAGFSLANNSWQGKVKDWDATLALTPSANHLHLDMHAIKSIGGGTIDVHGVGDLNGFQSEGSITLANGATTEITFNNNGVNAVVDFTWKVAFDAEHGGNDPKMRESDVENFPFSLDLPAPVGPIPFKITFKMGFAFVPFFTSKVAAASGSYHASFGGAMPMTDSADAPAPAEPAPAAAAGSDGLSGSGAIQSYGGTSSLATIGLSTTIALPKIGMTLGLPGPMNAFLHSPDFGGPYAMLETQANFFGTGSLTMVQCEKRDLKLMGVVGYKPGVLGKLKVPPLPPKLILERAYSEVRPPNITLCQ